ncbi:MAG: DUF3996 domain-containing protein [Treponema sp.]|nr:DUF3996 domain-containing protein [Treponema sp.]
MRRLLLCGILALFICISGVSAGGNNHPDKWALGPIFLGGYLGGYNAGGFYGGMLALKAPPIPVYWGIQLDFIDLNRQVFDAGFTGDYYVFDRMLVPGIKLGWYLGVGGFFSLSHYFGSGEWTYLNVGVRVPVALSWQPLSWLEIIGGITPCLGLHFYVAGKDGLHLNWPLVGELGARFWF